MMINSKQKPYLTPKAYLERFERGLQFAVERSELPGGLGQLLRVERVDLLQFPVTVMEELLVEVAEVSRDDLLLNALRRRGLLHGPVQHRFHLLEAD